jgi:uncharacterized membrane protein
MTIIILMLAVWALLGPFIIGAGLKRRIEALEREVAALRAARPSPATAETGAPSPIMPPVTRAPPIDLPTPFDFEPPRREPLSNASEMTLSAEEWAKSGRSGWAAFEEWLVQRWIIAAGGGAASLGGLFIVRYSIEQGLLGPLARIILGAVVGIALVAAAEFIRRRAPSPGQAAPAWAAQVPAAVSAAGMVTLYGVTYAAYAFYHLVPGPIAFITLAVIAFGSMAAGLLYGPLAAVVGTGMALLAPALIASDRPNATVLFPYLFVVTAGSLSLIRYRPWPWLVWLALAGNGLWHLSWALGIGGEQAPVRALHLLALPMLCVCLLLRDPWPEPGGPWWRWNWSNAPLPVWTVATTTLGGFAFLWVMAAETGFSGVAATAWGAGLILLLLLARWAPTQLPLLPIAAALTIGLVAAWAVPDMGPVGGSHWWFARGPLLAPTIAAYVAPAAAYASILGLGGFAMLWTSSRPAIWASVSAATPIAVLAVLYARLSGLAPSPPWAGVALVLAALALVAARRTARHRPLLEPCLAAYAAAVTAAVALAAAMTLHAAWLTVALALELPAMAWILRRTGGVPGLRALSGVIAAILAIRLLLNPYIPVYAGDMPILVNWLLYGYGIPAAACWLAARWFREETADDWVNTMLLAAALAFATALMTLELWHMASNGGPLLAVGDPLRQAAAVGNGWLALGLVLLRLDRAGGGVARGWGWRLIGVDWPGPF